jgi:hypothetical protein
MKTVTANHWSVSVTTGTDIDGAILSTRRQIGGRWELALDPKHPNFPNSDAAWNYARAKGFTQVYYSRPNGFIDLRLSPATRRYLRSKTNAEVWTLLPKILGVSPYERYFHTVESAGYMAERRHVWMNAIFGPRPTKRA